MDTEDNYSNFSEELITVEKVFENIENAWMNEKLSPEILPERTDMLELMVGQLGHMEENMKSLDKNDFRYIVHTMELERVWYILSSYLRCRIKKIEEFTKHILVEEDSRSQDEKRLSEGELIFAKDYLNHVEHHFQQIALEHMPNLQRSDANQQLVKPNLMSHVFIKANKTVPAVVVGVDDDEVDLVAGSQHIIPYQLISDLVLKGSVQLI